MYLYDDGDTTCGRQSEVSMRVINQSEGEHNGHDRGASAWGEGAMKELLTEGTTGRMKRWCDDNVVNRVNGNKDIFEKNIFIAFP